MGAVNRVYTTIILDLSLEFCRVIFVLVYGPDVSWSLSPYSLQSVLLGTYNNYMLYTKLLKVKFILNFLSNCTQIAKASVLAIIVVID